MVLNVELEADLWLQLLGDAVKYSQCAGNAAGSLPERFDNLLGILEGRQGGDTIHTFPWKTIGTKSEHAHERRVETLDSVSESRRKKKINGAASITNTFLIGACLAAGDGVVRDVLWLQR